MTSRTSRANITGWMRLLAWFTRRDSWLLLSGTALFVLAAWWVSDLFTAFMGQAAQVRAWIQTFDTLAPLVYIALFSLQILLAPIPGNFMGVMGGYLFGAGLGVLYSVLGMAVGAGLAIGLARKFGRPWLERFFPAAQLHKWERKLRVRSFFTWWVLFLFPVPDLIFYAAGLSRAPLRTLFLALITGRGLGLLLANLAGHWSAYLTPDAVLIKWTAIAILAAVVYFYQRSVRVWLLRAGRRFRRQRGGRHSYRHRAGMSR